MSGQPRPVVPEIPDGTTVEKAALLYAEAGWYVVPVDPGTKHPGSLVGKGWQHQASRDPGVIAQWWQQWPAASLALNVGKSGAVAFDVDEPTLMPAPLLAAVQALWPPYQTTRDPDIGRGHYLFGADPGQYGASVGGFREAGYVGWGEIRGFSGVIVVEPTPHTKPGGRYHWLQTGALPEVPPELAALLRPPGSSGYHADPEDVRAWLAGLPGAEPCPAVLAVIDRAAPGFAEVGIGGRHDLMLSLTQQLVRLGDQGHEGVSGALEDLRDTFAFAKPEASDGEYGQAVVGAIHNALAAPTDPDDRGCCPAWKQDQWMAASGWKAPTPPPAPPLVEELAGPRPDTVQGPVPQTTGPGVFGDAKLIETFAAEALLGRYRWTNALRWLRWDGRRWETCPAEVVVEQARQWALAHIQAAAAAAAEAAQMGDEGVAEAESIKNWLAVAKSAGRLATLVKYAGAVPGIITDAAQLDAHPDLLNVANGVLDLRTGVLNPHHPDLLLTKITETPYLKGARHWAWDKITEALPPAERDWLRIRLGQGITGHMTPDDVMVICQGSGENGKSTLFDAITPAAGEYQVLISDRVLLANPGDHPTELMDLRGARLAFVEETPEARRLNTVRLKKTVGSSAITARLIAKDSVTFKATHSLFVSTNYRPVVEETDHGTWRRLALLVFPYTFRKPHQALQGPLDRYGDEQLKYLAKTDPGVHAAALAWMVDGAWAWYQSGRRMPAPTPGIDHAVREWRGSSDSVYTFWDEFLEPAEGCAVLADDLHDAFTAWQLGQRQKEWSARTFTERFSGHEQTQSHGVYKERTRQNAPEWAISRRPVTGYEILKPVPREPVVWRNVKFSTGNDPQPVDNPNRENPFPATEGSQVVTRHERHGTPVDQLTSPSYSTLQTTVPFVPSLSVDGSSTLGDQGAISTESEVSRPESDQLPIVVDAPVKAPTKAELARAEKAAVKAAHVAELLGPDVPLPALVLRGQAGEAAVFGIEFGEAGQLLQAITGSGGALTVDVENSGYPVGHELYELRLVQLGNDAYAVVLDPDDPVHAELGALHLNAAVYLHAHSATADGVPLVDAGWITFEAFWDKMHDTVIPAKLADPQSTGSDPGLKKLAGAVLGDEACTAPAEEARAELFKAAGWLTDTEITTPVERSGWAQVRKTSATFLRYAGSDVLDTAAVARQLPAIPDEILIRERTAQRMTARAAHTGFRIDGDLVDRLMGEHKPARDELAARITAEYGIGNPGSAQQVAQALTERGVRLPRTKPSRKFPDGQPSVAEGVLEALRAAGGLPEGAEVLIELLLAYRHHKTVVSTFLTPYYERFHRGDGRARPTVYTLGADTGRTSCVRPNAQQLPREGGVRQLYTVDDGYVFISADFASVEIRTAAALSQDPALLQMLEEGLQAESLVTAGLMTKREWQERYDPHAMAARIVFGQDWTKADRYTVKRGVFGRIYGGAVDTIARQMNATIAVAQQLIDTIDRLWPRLAEWSREISAGLRFGHTTFTAYSGRVIHLPVGAPHAAPNYCIQGTARELLVDALMRWNQTEWRDCTLLPVHDELIVMVPAADAERATAELVRCMETTLYGVRIVAEPGEPATAWQDAA